MPRVLCTYWKDAPATLCEWAPSLEVGFLAMAAPAITPIFPNLTGTEWDTLIWTAVIWNTYENWLLPRIRQSA